MASGGSGEGRGRSVLIHEFVTGGGMAGSDLPPSLAAEGGAMRRALAADFAATPGVRVTMTLDAGAPEEPGPWQVVRVGPGEEPGAFARLASEADYTLVVAPETGGILFDRAREIARVGGRSLGCAPAAIAEAGNKLVAFERLRAAGIRTPPTRAVGPRDGWPRRITFPIGELSRVCPLDEVPALSSELPPVQIDHAEFDHPGVLKPVDGAGSMHTYLLTGPSDWPDPAWRPEVAVLQPWVDGEPRSASMLVGPEGRAHVLGFGRVRTAVDRGRVAYRGGVAPLRFGEAELRMVARVVDAFPGLRGWVGIDYVLNRNGVPVVLEVNPRPTTSIVAFLDLLGPGTLAGAWLGLLDGSARGLPTPIFRLLRARLGRPTPFDADGTVHPPRDGARA